MPDAPSRPSLIKSVLANGVTIVVDPDRRFNTAAYAVAFCGGLRGERPEQAGSTHLLEHLLFKRTRRLDTLAIAREIDELGGELNAYTDDDTLCLHGETPASRFERMQELLGELATEATFTEEDFEREQEIVRQEILDAQDDPAEVTYCHFSRLFWPGDMLSYPVFGTVETVENLSSADIRSRYRQLLTGRSIIIGAAGNVCPDKVIRHAERCFGSLPAGRREEYAQPKQAGGFAVFPESFGQVHFSYAFPWPSFRDEAYFPALLLATVLGEGMSSRLFQRVREEHGLLYDIGAQADTYRDTGALSISGAVEREKVGSVLELIVGELQKVRQDLITDEELARAVALTTAQLEMEQDSVSDRLWRAVETERIFGRYIGAEEIVTKLKAVSIEVIRRTAHAWLGEPSFVPSDVLPHHDKSLLLLAGDVEGLSLPDIISGWS